jgi:hypothetical protein
MYVSEGSVAATGNRFCIRYDQGAGTTKFMVKICSSFSEEDDYTYFKRPEIKLFKKL